MTLPASLLRPTEPLPSKPAGYLSLATYSSLGRLWTYLSSAQRHGRAVSLVRGDSERVCRRRVSGYALDNAGILLDEHKLRLELESSLLPHPALLALLSGDASAVRRLVSEDYQLQVHFVLALTRGRELVLRPEFKYAPTRTPTLPSDLTLSPRRLGRDELRFMLDRACGL